MGGWPRDPRRCSHLFSLVWSQGGRPPGAGARVRAHEDRGSLSRSRKQDDGVTVSMFTESDEDTKKWWPAEFRLVYRATFGSELSLELEVTNTGKTALHFEEALHAYFRVGNIEKARVRGSG